MTEIERKALALVDEVILEVSSSTLVRFDPYNPTLEAVRRAIEQHDAFRQEVSDAVESLLAMPRCDFDEVDLVSDHLGRFIIAKHDPLVEAMLGAWPQYADRMDACNSDANALRTALAARGLEIREKQP